LLKEGKLPQSEILEGIPSNTLYEDAQILKNKGDDKSLDAILKILMSRNDSWKKLAEETMEIISFERKYSVLKQKMESLL
ncbi:MAG: hypothetical protein JXR91_11160, partial [Deltaproteobacteria bacterium]|nr:hypothetical protein [Deltaproteobacteria bacterium]